MSEVKDLHNLVIERIETLDTNEHLSIMLIGPPVSSRSSFTHVLKNLLAYFSTKSYNTTYFRTFENNNEIDKNIVPKGIEIKSGNIEKLTELIETLTPNLLFFVDYPEITDGVLQNLQKKNVAQNFYVWQYFKPRANVLSKHMIDWLSKKVDRVFMPSEFYEPNLKSQLSKKLDVLHIPVSSSYFKMERESVERIIEIPKSKFRWLCPDRFNEISQIDTVISAFAKYVIQDDHKDEQLLLLGNISEFDCYPVFDIYANELLHLGKDINDYAKNLIILNEDSISKLTDENLNMLYNLCDYVVSARNFCSHSYSFLNLASLGMPMLLPNHTWFSTFVEDYSGITLQPIHHAQYNTISSFGIKYFISPTTLSEKMTEIRKVIDQEKPKPWQPKKNNFKNLLDKYLQILTLETSPNRT